MLAVSRGLDRDRVVDETGGQTVVFGRRGSRPVSRRRDASVPPPQRMAAISGRGCGVRTVEEDREFNGQKVKMKRTGLFHEIRARTGGAGSPRPDRMRRSRPALRGRSSFRNWKCCAAFLPPPPGRPPPADVLRPTQPRRQRPSLPRLRRRSFRKKTPPPATNALLCAAKYLTTEHTLWLTNPQEFPRTCRGPITSTRRARLAGRAWKWRASMR